MDDFGNIIYIVLLIIISVVGSISKSLKARKAAKNATPQQPTADDVFESTNGHDDDETYHDVVSKPAAPTNQEFPKAHPQPTIIKPRAETIEATNAHTTPHQPLKAHHSSLHHAATTSATTSSESTPPPDLSTPQGARAAFIASEIFNRKY